MIRLPDVAACARCGSGRVHPKLLMMGPIAGIDSDSRTFICEDCRHEGLPVMFDTEDARALFEREAKGLAPPEAPATREGPLTIPILPVLTAPLIDMRILDLVPVRLASVVGVRWEGAAISAGPYRASFQEYWDAIGGPRYNASRVLMLDLTGINRANPNFEVLRHLVKRCDVWLDLGAREPEEVMDGYMLDVERIVAGSKTLAKLEAFAGLYALSSEALPCLDWAGRVVWRDSREERTDLRQIARALRSIGFEAACVMDLRRLGTESGPDPLLVGALEGLDLEIYLGGGVQETDIAGLAERGLAGGFVDPYTPVIRDLLRHAEKEVPASVPPAPAPVEKASSSRGPVPDPGCTGSWLSEISEKSESFK
ncbi:MAG TPA: HisA/HisF-related TIM barrel protein [Thermoplasmata archaeon]|nr:HisA/HisF-related TIM barrel protein [Thermoplasmata archaeon]